MSQGTDVNYIIATGYDKAWRGAHMHELITTGILSVNNNYLLAVHTEQEQTVEDFIYTTRASRITGGIQCINFDIEEDSQSIIQNCGSLGRFKTCDKICIGYQGDKYILYDINSKKFRKVSKHEIIENKWHIQNMNVNTQLTKSSIELIGGKKHLIDLGTARLTGYDGKVYDRLD